MKLLSIVTMLALSLVSVNAVTFTADSEQEWPSNTETGSETLVFDFTLSGTGIDSLTFQFSEPLSEKPVLFRLDPDEGLKRVKHYGGGWGSSWTLSLNANVQGTGTFAVRVKSPSSDFTVHVTGENVDTVSRMRVGGSMARLQVLGLLETAVRPPFFRLENADGDAIRLPETNRITVVNELPPSGANHHFRMHFVTQSLASTTSPIIINNERGRLVSFTPVRNDPIPGNTQRQGRSIHEREKSDNPDLKPDLYISLFDPNFDSNSVIVKVERLTGVDRGFFPGIYTAFVPEFEGIASVQGMHFMVVMPNENHQ